MAAHAISFLPISSSYSPSTKKSASSLKPSILVTSFLGDKLPIRSLNLGIFVAPNRRNSTVATVSLSLPNPKAGKVAEKGPTWSARAIKSFAMAELEARKLKYPKTGTESLLMGILVEGTSLAAKFLREKGITLFKVRDETVNLLGKSDLYFFSPEHPPLTEQAKRALDWAVQEKLKSGESGEITTTHMLLGIWSEKESAGHKILAGLGFDDEKAKELAKNMDKDIILSFK